jgi:lysophospholipase L1-like esterase
VPSDWQATVGQHLQNSGGWGLLNISSPGATLRQVVHTTSGGTAVRVRITNRVGTEPLRIDQATVAVSTQRQGAASTVAGPIKALTFGGRAGVQVPIGSEVVSDAIRFDSPIPSGHDVAVSLFIPQHSGPADLWIVGNETSFQAAGNQVDATSLTGPASGPATVGVAAVDLLTPSPQGTVVVLADSITDGYGDGPLLDTADDTDPNTTANWTDVFYGLLAAAGRAQTGVVNEGLVADMLGPAPTVESGLERLDREVLAQTGITTMIVELGNNDVRGRPGLTADQLTSEFQTLVQRAHAAGVRVIGMTIPPIWFPTRSGDSCTYEGTTLNQAQEAIRNTVNQRMSDRTIPFDDVVPLAEVYGAPPGDPGQFDLAMVGDDCIHPGELGRSSIAAAVIQATL